MPKQSGGRIVQVLVIDQHLPGNFIVSVLAVPKHLAIAREKWQRHKDTISPKLPLPALRVRMPKPAVFGAGISIEDSADIFGRELVLFLFRFFIEYQQKISRHYVIEGVDRPINPALVVDVQIDPRLNMIQITLVLRSEVDEVDPIKIKRLGIAPAFQRFGGGKTFDSGINYGFGPVDVGGKRFTSVEIRARQSDCSGSQNANHY